jgi:hypothetical protein
MPLRLQQQTRGAGRCGAAGLPRPAPEGTARGRLSAAWRPARPCLGRGRSEFGHAAPR